MISTPGRNRAQDRRSLPHPIALMVTKEEQLILEDRAAHRSAELVLAVLALLRWIEVVSSVEYVIAEKFKESSVKIVGARLGTHQYRTSATAAILG